MPLNAHVCYRALLARDTRHDGRFFVCVRSTGIYCRPICPARTPRQDNCHFVPTAAAAQEAGYRPCLRCRPESSPDLGAWRGTSATVSRALALIEAGALDESDVETLADRLGVGERHLRRLFRQHLGAAPVTVAQTRRVLLAKQLLHETSLPMTRVALASGFASVRRFNETFQQLYGRPPSSLRRRPTTPAAASDKPELVLRLRYQPPYDWSAMLAFLAARALPGVEQVSETGYRRVIAVDGAAGLLAVSHEPRALALRIEVRFPVLSALSGIIARVRRMFDLSADPRAIGRALARDRLLAPLVKRRPGLRIPGAWDGFETGARAILGQQVTVAAATRLAGRLVERFGQPFSDPHTPGLSHRFPQPAAIEAVGAAEVARLGMPVARARALVALATTATAEPDLFDPGDPDRTAERLLSIPGVGPWTAQYIGMRVLRQCDAFLPGDVAVRRAFARSARCALPDAKKLAAHADRWRPWRAYAVLHLWNADLDTPPCPDKEQHAISA